MQTNQAPDPRQEFIKPAPSKSEIESFVAATINSQSPLTSINDPTFVMVDEYGGVRWETLDVSAEKSIQRFIDKFNADVDASPLPKLAPKKLKDWEDVNKLGMCVAQISFKYVKGWKVSAA